MSPLKEYAHALIASLNGLPLGRIVQFDLSPDEVLIVDQYFDDFAMPPETDDPEERNALVGVANLFASWERWKSSARIVRPGVQTNAGEAFQAAVDLLSRALIPRVETPIEPMHELAAQRGNDPPISHAKIAKMHRLFKPNGEPDADRVRAELAKGPEKCYRYVRKEFLPGADLTGQYEAATRDLPRLLENRRVSAQSERPAERSPAQESYGQLAKLPHITLVQIAKMKRVTPAEAEAELVHLGLIVSGMKSVLAKPSEEVLHEPQKDDRLRFAESIRRSTKAGFDPEKPVKFNVQKLAKAGFSAAEIESAFADQTGAAPSMEEIAEYLPETVEA